MVVWGFKGEYLMDVSKRKLVCLDRLCELLVWIVGFACLAWLIYFLFWFASLVGMHLLGSCVCEVRCIGVVAGFWSIYPSFLSFVSVFSVARFHSSAFVFLTCRLHLSCS